MSRLRSRLARRLLGPKFVKHYVKPRQVRKPQQQYAAREFFESWHRASGDALEDSDTISAAARPIDTRFHYNAIENTLLAYFARTGRLRPRAVLDIGSGAGHWVDFYLDVLEAGSVTGVELSTVACEQLAARHANDPRVRILNADIAAPEPGIDGSFDVVNAIGVMFHIVDDGDWRRALGNLRRLLAPDGVIAVGGQFGRTTANVQFHSVDRFSSWEELRSARSDVALVNKRIRSLRDWKRAAAGAELLVETLLHTPWAEGITTPENNVLVLRAR